MMLQHDHFDLFGKIIMEKVKFHPPLKVSKMFHDEACFFHILNGESKLLTPTQKFSFQSKENFVLKCGSVVNNWLKKVAAKENSLSLGTDTEINGSEHYTFDYKDDYKNYTALSI